MLIYICVHLSLSIYVVYTYVYTYTDFAESVFVRAVRGLDCLLPEGQLSEHFFQECEGWSFFAQGPVGLVGNWEFAEVAFVPGRCGLYLLATMFGYLPWLGASICLLFEASSLTWLLAGWFAAWPPVWLTGWRAGWLPMLSCWPTGRFWLANYRIPRFLS